MSFRMILHFSSYRSFVFPSVFLQQETATSTKDIPTPSHCTNSQTIGVEKPIPSLPQKLETSSDMHPNGFVTRLLVNTVWLNFATPKRLPNKRRIKLVRWVNAEISSVRSFISYEFLQIKLEYVAVSILMPLNALTLVRALVNIGAKSLRNHTVY